MTNIIINERGIVITSEKLQSFNNIEISVENYVQ